MWRYNLILVQRILNIPWVCGWIKCQLMKRFVKNIFFCSHSILPMYYLDFDVCNMPKWFNYGWTWKKVSQVDFLIGDGDTWCCLEMRCFMFGTFEFFTIGVSVRLSDRFNVTQNKINFAKKLPPVGLETRTSGSSGQCLTNCQIIWQKRLSWKTQLACITNIVARWGDGSAHNDCWCGSVVCVVSMSVYYVSQCLVRIMVIQLCYFLSICYAFKADSFVYLYQRLPPLEKYYH